MAVVQDWQETASTAYSPSYPLTGAPTDRTDRTAVLPVQELGALQQETRSGTLDDMKTEGGAQYQCQLEPDERLRMLMELFEQLHRAREPSQIDSLAQQLLAMASSQELLQLSVVTHAMYGNDDRLRLGARLLHRKGTESFFDLNEFIIKRPKFAVFFVGLAADEDAYVETQRAQLLLTLSQVQDDDVDDLLISAVRTLSPRHARQVLEELLGRPGISSEAQEAITQLQEA